MINQPFEYVKVLINDNNVFYIGDNVVTLEELGIDGWEMVAILPNRMYIEVNTYLEDKSLYFVSSYPSGKRDMITITKKIPYHIAIFKRRLWNDIS